MSEAEKEIQDAKVFGLTVEELRTQRRELGQLVTGPYAGCSPAFAAMMEACIASDMERIFKQGACL